MTPTLTTIRFESAYLLCHVNTIDAHLMRIQFDLLWIRIETGLQPASCERALIVAIFIACQLYRHVFVLSTPIQKFYQTCISTCYTCSTLDLFNY